MLRGVVAALFAIGVAAIVGPACSGGGARTSGCPLPPVRASGQLVGCCGPGVACNGICVGGQCDCPYDVPGGCPVGSVCCEDGCHRYVPGFVCAWPAGGTGGMGGGTAGTGGSGGAGTGGSGASGGPGGAGTGGSGAAGGTGGAPSDGGDCSPSAQFHNEASCCNGVPCDGECHDGQCVCNLGGGNYSAGCTDGLVCCIGHGCERHTMPPQDVCTFGPA